MRSDSTLPPTRPAATAGTRAALGMSLGTIGGLLAALIAMLVLFGTLSPTFFSLPTFTTIANEIPDLLVMAVGMTFILMIGGIDLSVGSVLALSASVLSVAMTQLGWGLLPAALAGVVLATAAGMLTGAVTVHWGIPSFIVSLGVLEMARGLAYSLTDSRTVYIGSAVDWLANPIALGIAPSFLIAIAITVVGQIVLVRTVFGRYLVAIGTNEEAVRLAGVNPRPYKIAVFALMGLLSGLAAL
ncbi:MAG: ABC transporter permease, partial [Pseudomonadota bacterium]